MYHLYDEADINKAMEEAIRVTKPGGKIFIAYITDDAVVLSYGVRKGNLRRLKDLCDENWNVKKIAEEIFATYKIKNFDELVNKFNLNKLETIATDGIAPKKFQIYLDYHLKNCDRKDLMGYSCHILEIVEKKEE